MTPIKSLAFLVLSLAFVGVEQPGSAKTPAPSRPAHRAAPSAPATPLPSSAPYAAGDAAFIQRNDPERAKRALELFRDYHAKNPKDPEAGWRHAMGCYFAGLHLAKNGDEKESLFAEGRDAGLSTIQLAPACAPCHFWTAINMALYGQTVGVFKMFFSLPSIREHLEQTIKLDPAYAGGGAYRLLGLIEQKLPGILGGSNDRARELIQQAIDTAPEEPLNHLFMTRLLLEEFDDLAGARAIAKKGISVPQPSPERIESLGSLKELREFLNSHPAE